jgi:hypothetical protein
MFFFYPCYSTSLKTEKTLWIEDIVATPSFLTILKWTWLVLWILTRWLLEGMHFQPFLVDEMKVNQKKGQQVKGKNINFHKWKGI